MTRPKVKKTARKNHKNRYPIISLSSKDKWDKADLIQLSKAIESLSDEEKNEIGILLDGVIHIAEGFFGALYSRAESGMKIHLIRPTERIEATRWFQIHTIAEGTGIFLFTLDQLAPSPIYHTDDEVKNDEKIIEAPADEDAELIFDDEEDEGSLQESDKIMAAHLEALRRKTGSDSSALK